MVPSLSTSLPFSQSVATVIIIIYYHLHSFITQARVANKNKYIYFITPTTDIGTGVVRPFVCSRPCMSAVFVCIALHFCVFFCV